MHKMDQVITPIPCEITYESNWPDWCIVDNVVTTNGAVSSCIGESVSGIVQKMFHNQIKYC